MRLCDDGGSRRADRAINRPNYTGVPPTPMKWGMGGLVEFAMHESIDRFLVRDGLPGRGEEVSPRCAAMVLSILEVD